MLRMLNALAVALTARIIQSKCEILEWLFFIHIFFNYIKI
jgi:hypothetical protein